MMESRRSYGWATGRGVLSKKDQQKWQVAYRCHDGGFGIIGWRPLFESREEAEEFGRQFKAENDYVKEIIVRHPDKTYSNY